MKQLHIQYLQPGESLTIELGEDVIAKDDGRGVIDIKKGRDQVGWLSMTSGILVCDPALVDSPTDPPSVPSPTPPATPTLPPGPPRPPGR